MQRIAKLLFWLSVLVTVCCGCRWCGTDYQGTEIMKEMLPVEHKPRNHKPKASERIDFTVEDERGFRERFECASVEEFSNRVFKYCLGVWKAKTARYRNVLATELTVILDANFRMGRTNFAFEHGGLKFLPTAYYLKGGQAATYNS